MKLTDIILKEFNRDLLLPDQPTAIKKILEKVYGRGQLKQQKGNVFEFVPNNTKITALPESVRDTLYRLGWSAAALKTCNVVRLWQTVTWTPVDTTGKVVIHIASEKFSSEYFLKTGFRTKDDGTRNLKATYGVLLPKNYSDKDLSNIIGEISEWMDMEGRDIYEVDLGKYKLPWYPDLMDREYGGFPAVLTISNIPGNCLRRLGTAEEFWAEASSWDAWNAGWSSSNGDYDC